MATTKSLEDTTADSFMNTLRVNTLSLVAFYRKRIAVHGFSLPQKLLLGHQARLSCHVLCQSQRRKRFSGWQHNIDSLRSASPDVVIQMQSVDWFFYFSRGPSLWSGYPGL